MAQLYGIVQTNLGAGSSVAFGAPVTSGNLLVVAYQSDGGISASTISDTLGTSYTLAQYVTGYPLSLIVWYGTAPSTGTNTVSIGSAANYYDRLTLVEISGVSATLNAVVGNHASDQVPLNSYPPPLVAYPLATTYDGSVDYGTEVGTSSPSPLVNTNTIFARWQGSFTAPTTGSYIIGANCDDSAKITIDGYVDSAGITAGGVVVASCVGRGGFSYNYPNYVISGTINLNAGDTHSLILDYVNGGGPYEIQLLWTPPGGSIQLIPSSVWVGGTIEGNWWNFYDSIPPNNLTSITTTAPSVVLSFAGGRGGSSVLGVRFTPWFNVIGLSSYSGQETTALAVMEAPAGTYECYWEGYSYYSTWSCPVVNVAFPVTDTNVYVSEVGGFAVLVAPTTDVVVTEVHGYAVLDSLTNTTNVTEVNGYAVMVTAGSEVVGGVQLVTDLPNGTVGVFYNVTINTSTGSSPFTFAVIGGSLPTGLSINFSTGVISGTPSAANIYLFTLLVTDINGNTGSEGFRITTSASSGTGGGNYGYV